MYIDIFLLERIGIDMNSIRIIFNSIIIIFSSILGYVYGNIYTKRARNLLDLQYCIRILESEIINGNLPLPQALHNTYIKGRGKIKILFNEIKEDLLVNKREDVYSSFLIQRDILRDRYAFKDLDIEIFLYLGKILGKTNKIDQEKKFSFVITQLDNHYIEAESEKKKNTKLYRTLGFLLGLGVVIILI